MTVLSILVRVADTADRSGRAALARAAHLAWRHAAPIGATLLLGFTAVVALTALFFPITEWDMIAYVATVLERGIADPTALHAEAYEMIRQSVSPGRFLVLTEDRPYRIAQFADAAAFHSMLGFYRVKWLYIETIALLSQFMPPVAAIRAVSAASAVGVGLTVTVWLAMAGRLIWAPLAVAALIAAGFGTAARLATPDLFASLFFLVAVVSFLRRSEVLVALALFLAFLARPDHLAFIGVFMVVSIYMRQASIGAVVAFAAGILAYMPLTSMTGHPSWWVQFWFTNVEYASTLEGFAPAFSIAVYLKALVQVLVRSLVEDAWPGLLIACLAGWLALERWGQGVGARERTLLAALLLTICAKFVILPMHDMRFHFAYLAAMALTLIVSLPDSRHASLPPEGNLRKT